MLRLLSRRSLVSRLVSRSTGAAFPAAGAAQPEVLRVDAVVFAPGVVRAIGNVLLRAGAPQLVQPDVPGARRGARSTVPRSADLHRRALRLKAELLASDLRSDLIQGLWLGVGVKGLGLRNWGRGFEVDG